jgi:predicted transcriptional regulator
MKELDKVKQAIIEILDSEISGYSLAKITGISKSMVSRYRSGHDKIENMTLGTAEKILKLKDQE